MKRRLGEQPIGADVRLLRVLLGKVGLSQPGGWFPFSIYQSGKQYQATSAGWPFSGSLSRSLVVRSYFQTYYVATTNNGSNYWRFHLVELGASGSYTMKVLNSSAGSPDQTGQVSDTAINRSVVHPTRLALRVYIDKVGSPGTLYLYGPAVFVT